MQDLTNNKIRKIILNEFYKRAQGISENPKIHMLIFQN